MQKRTHSKQNLNPDYVVGLVDGEGSFTVYVRNPDAEKVVVRRVVVEPKFYIKLIERDKDILYASQDFFGVGSVYFQKDTRPNHQHCYRYEVFRWEELQTIIIPFFKQHKLKFASKRHDFEIFCLMMKLLQKGTHRTEKGLRELFKLKQRMH
ncbi:MAG: LAGLIDADG family homing endonuclease [bacterium]|nr:LAGLIDADG family homing endonuclease [bacterium]